MCVEVSCEFIPHVNLTESPSLAAWESIVTASCYANSRAAIIQSLPYLFICSCLHLLAIRNVLSYRQPLRVLSRVTHGCSLLQCCGLMHLVRALATSPFPELLTCCLLLFMYGLALWVQCRGGVCSGFCSMVRLKLRVGSCRCLVRCMSAVDSVLLGFCRCLQTAQGSQTDDLITDKYQD